MRGTSARGKVEFRVVAEDAFLVEGKPALGREIGLDPRQFAHLHVERDQKRIVRFGRLHRLREGIAQPLQEMKQRQVDIGQRPADGMDLSLAIAERPFEVAGRRSSRKFSARRSASSLCS